MLGSMDRRSIAAVVSLALVGAVVGALLATAGDGDDPVRSASPTVGVGDTPDPAETSSTDPADASTAPTAPSVTSVTSVTSVDETATVATDAPPGDPLVPELPNRGAHPPLLEVDEWLQTDIASLDELRGKVVAVQFWTFGCSNCKATIPHMQALYEKYGGDDFEIVGVHAPEFDYEADPEAVAQAAIDLGVTWPIALDTEKRSFRSWQTERRFWPRLYLIDREGNIRYDKIGEGKYDVIDAAVGALIAEPA